MTGIANQLSLADQACVRDRLRERRAVAADNWILADLLRSAPDQVTSLAERLAALIGVPAKYLRSEDKFHEILRVHREELPPEVQPLMAKAGLADVIDPFAFALLDFVEKPSWWRPNSPSTRRVSSAAEERRGMVRANPRYDCW